MNARRLRAAARDRAEFVCREALLSFRHYPSFSSAVRRA